MKKRIVEKTFILNIVKKKKGIWWGGLVAMETNQDGRRKQNNTIMGKD